MNGSFMNGSYEIINKHSSTAYIFVTELYLHTASVLFCRPFGGNIDIDVSRLAIGFQKVCIAPTPALPMGGNH